jgi:hypothetical protein
MRRALLLASAVPDGVNCAVVSWLTEDRCGSTKVTVKRGTVVVRDFAKHKNKIIKKGHSYVALG